MTISQVSSANFLTFLLNSMPHGVDIAKNLLQFILKLLINLRPKILMLDLQKLMQLKTQSLQDNTELEDILLFSFSWMDKKLIILVKEAKILWLIGSLKKLETQLFKSTNSNIKHLQQKKVYQLFIMVISLQLKEQIFSIKLPLLMTTILIIGEPIWEKKLEAFN